MLSRKLSKHNQSLMPEQMDIKIDKVLTDSSVQNSRWCSDFLLKLSIYKIRVSNVIHSYIEKLWSLSISEKDMKKALGRLHDFQKNIMVGKIPYSEKTMKQISEDFRSVCMTLASVNGATTFYELISDMDGFHGRKLPRKFLQQVSKEIGAVWSPSLENMDIILESATKYLTFSPNKDEVLDQNSQMSEKQIEKLNRSQQHEQQPDMLVSIPGIMKSDPGASTTELMVGDEENDKKSKKRVSDGSLVKSEIAVGRKSLKKESGVDAANDSRKIKKEKKVKTKVKEESNVDGISENKIKKFKKKVKEKSNIDGTSASQKIKEKNPKKMVKTTTKSTQMVKVNIKGTIASTEEGTGLHFVKETTKKKKGAKVISKKLKKSSTDTKSTPDKTVESERLSNKEMDVIVGMKSKEEKDLNEVNESQRVSVYKRGKTKEQVPITVNAKSIDSGNIIINLTETDSEEENECLIIKEVNKDKNGTVVINRILKESPRKITLKKSSPTKIKSKKDKTVSIKEEQRATVVGNVKAKQTQDKTTSILPSSTEDKLVRDNSQTVKGTPKKKKGTALKGTPKKKKKGARVISKKVKKTPGKVSQNDPCFAKCTDEITNDHPIPREAENAAAIVSKKVKKFLVSKKRKKSQGKTTTIMPSSTECIGKTTNHNPSPRKGKTMKESVLPVKKKKGAPGKKKLRKVNSSFS